MNKDYIAPDVELLKLNLTVDVLAISDPDQGVSSGSGSGQSDPEVDPFGDPRLDP